MTMTGRCLVRVVVLSVMLAAASAGPKGRRKMKGAPSSSSDHAATKLERANDRIDKAVLAVSETVDELDLNPYFFDSMSDIGFVESTAGGTVIELVGDDTTFWRWMRIYRLYRSIIRLSVAIQCIIDAIAGGSSADHMAVYLSYEERTTEDLWKQVQNLAMNSAYNGPSPNNIAGITASATKTRATVLYEASSKFAFDLARMNEEMGESHGALKVLQSAYGDELSVRWTENSPLPGREPLVDGRFTSKHLLHWLSLIEGIQTCLTRLTSSLKEAERRASQAERIASQVDEDQKADQDPHWEDLFAVLERIEGTASAPTSTTSSRSKKTKARRKKKQGVPSTSSDHDSEAADSIPPSLPHTATGNVGSLYDVSSYLVGDVLPRPWEDSALDLGYEMNVFVHSINNELQNMLQLLAGCLSAITDRIRAVAPSATFAVVGSAGKGMNLPLPHSDLDILATLTSDELAQFEDNERELVLPLRTNARGMQVLQMPAFPLPNGDATIKVDLVPVSDKSSGSLLDVVAVRRRPDYHRTRAMVLYLKAFLRVKSSMVDPLLSSPGVGGMSSYLLQVLVIAYVDSVPDTCANGDLRFCIVGFFGYYGKYFDFANYCIDVTSSDNRFPPKSTFTGPHFTFSSVCAVDPHDPTNNLGEMTYRISLIRKVFGAAYDDLTLNDVTLLSLFPAPVTLSGNPLF